MRKTISAIATKRGMKSLNKTQKVKKVSATFWDLHLFDEDGLIMETWNLIDNAAIMQQIGVLK